jgi:DNA-3-methyladenine glycosylase II
MLKGGHVVSINCLSAEMLVIAERHLSQSGPVMAQLVATHGRCSILSDNLSGFQTLVGSIIGQQLSVKAADTIKRRVLELVPSFTPEGFLSVSCDALRSAGLSAAKTRYIIELSHWVKDRRLDFDALAWQPDEEVIAALAALPGVGRWTAEMFLIFGFKRSNVLSLGDAGLKRATRLLYGEDAELNLVGRAWEPFCSVASLYLWQHLDALP